MKTRFLFVLLVLALLCACGGGETADTSASAGETDGIRPLVGTPTDYSDPANWIARPEITKEADTFYIYPTSYMPSSPDAPSGSPGSPVVSASSSSTAASGSPETSGSPLS